MKSVLVIMSWEIVQKAGQAPGGHWRLGPSWALSLGRDFNILIDDFFLFTITGEVQKR
jgi:hypothetical protein